MAAPRQAAAVMLGAVLRGTRPGPGWAAALGGALREPGAGARMGLSGAGERDGMRACRGRDGAEEAGGLGLVEAALSPGPHSTARSHASPPCEGPRCRAALRQPRSLLPPAGSPLVQAARAYARRVRRSRELPSQLDDIPPTMLRKEYASLPIIDKVDDVVKKILSLEMAGQREKVKIKMEQLAEKVRRAPNDNGSSEVQVAYLTAKIRSYQEHLQKHPKDARNRRVMLMAIDQRKKILSYLRRTRYDVFENTCKQLDIEYTLPPPYCRKVTKLWLVKKAFCLQVFKEVQKLKAPERLKKR